MAAATQVCACVCRFMSPSLTLISSCKSEETAWRTGWRPGHESVAMSVAQFFDSAAQGNQSLQFSSSLRHIELAALAADLQPPRANAADYIGLAAADQWGHPALVCHAGYLFACQSFSLIELKVFVAQSSLVAKPKASGSAWSAWVRVPRPVPSPLSCSHELTSLRGTGRRWSARQPDDLAGGWQRNDDTALRHSPQYIHTSMIAMDTYSLATHIFILS